MSYALAFKDANSFAMILPFTHDIMVAPNKLKCASRKMLHDLANDLPFFIVMAMEKIAEKNDSPRLMHRHEVDKGLGVPLISRGWNRETRPAKVIYLAKMEVCNDENLFVFKKNCLFGKQ